MTSHPDYWTIAAEVCTPRELEALRLYDQRLSYRTISLHMGISPQRAKQLVDRASQKIDLHRRKEPAA
jgi:DNA-binding CsgD family transcriptional regulator